MIYDLSRLIINVKNTLDNVKCYKMLQGLSQKSHSFFK